MGILYHTGKANVVVDSLSKLSMENTSHVKDDKRELVKDVHKLTRLGVRLMDSTERGIVVTDTLKLTSQIRSKAVVSSKEPN